MGAFLAHRVIDQVTISWSLRTREETMKGKLLLRAPVVILMFLASLPAFAQYPGYDSVFAVDRMYSNYPSSTRNIAYDPGTGTVQVLYLPQYTPADTISRLYWGCSTDNGSTWSKLGPLDLGRTGYDKQVLAALTTAADRTPYIVWVEYGYSANRAICFTRDEGFNLGLWRPPLVLSDTTTGVVSIPDVAVSPDGQVVLVTWLADGNVLFTRSTNGGTTFSTPIPILVKSNPLFPVIVPEGQTLGRPTLAIGTGGKVALLAAYWKSNKRTFSPTYDCWPVTITSADTGTTWGTPVLAAPPAGYSSAHNSAGGFYGGGVILVNNLAHFPWQWGIMKDSTTVDEQSFKVFEARTDAGGAVHWSQISRDVDLCFSTWSQGGFSSISADATGKIFVLYQDLYNPGFWHLNIRASSDGGVSWSHAKPLIPLSGKVWSPEVAAVAGAQVHWVGVKGGGWTFDPTTALVHGKVDAESIFAYVPPPPEIADPGSTGGYTYTTSATPGGVTFAWKDLTTHGTRIPNAAWLDNNAPANPRDDGWYEFNLGFDFPFFGTPFTSIYVGVNGAMSFGAPHNFYLDNTDIPGTPIDNLVAVFWTDMYLDSAYWSPSLYGHGAVYTWTNAAKDSAIVEWHSMQSTDATDTTITFQAILAQHDSSLTFQYLNTGRTGVESKVAVGIQRDTSTGLLFVKGCPLANIPQPGLAVKFKGSGTTGIGEERGSPYVYALHQNYPNPFNPSTTISYELAARGSVELMVYNVLGQTVATVVNGVQSAGKHSIAFDGSRLTSGVYFCRLRAGEFVKTQKLLLLK
jgi:hypothetical protein